MRGYARSGSVFDGSRGRLHCTCSPPRAGKSTFANAWATAESARPRVVLSGDDFRKALHGQEYSRVAEGMVCATLDVAARALLDRGYDVLIDETCTTEETFARYMRLDPDFVLHVIDADEQVCTERAILNNQTELIGVIERIFPQYLWMKANHEELRAKWRVKLAG